MAITYESCESNEMIAPNFFGHFRDEGREFVITDLATPMPWANVMSNGRYGVVVSQNGGGFSWGENCQVARVTRWDQDLVEDRQGRFIFLQDLDSPERVWSTTLQPTLIHSELDEVVHGLGYTHFRRCLYGIDSEHTVFVPRDKPCEISIVRLRNTGDTPRRLRLASYLEWHLGASSDWHREFHRLFYQVTRERDLLVVRKLPGLKAGSREIEGEHPIGFHGTNGLLVDHWISDKRSFLGAPANLACPGFFFGYKPELANPRWNDPVGVAIGTVTIMPGESKSICFVTGSTDNPAEGRELIDYFTPARAEDELASVKANWVEFCERTELSTGNVPFDIMNNYWLKYQALACRMLARCAYYQQGGAYGFRDQLQDSLGMLTLDPELTKRQIVTHAEATYEDGGVRHWWHPGTDIFVESHHSDTCLWVPYSTLAYLDETNDLSVLDIACRYLDRKSQAHGSSGTLLDHIVRGIEHALSNLSPRGLPLILGGDWNDGLSHAGLDRKGESVWLGMFLYDILRRWGPLMTELGMGDKATAYKCAASSLREAVDSYGWDGEWYLQGTRDDGKLLGSALSEEGKIYLNPQSWSVISGIASEERATCALDSAQRHLVKPYGALLLAPAYSKPDPYIGYITRYAPGLRENGGVYSHASTWMIQALAMAGNQDEARSLYSAMLPCNGRAAEEYVAEPYVMPGNVDGPDSPFEGRAGWTWYTGSAAWLYRVALDWICGIRASRDGLIVAAKSGSKPISYELRRPFRGDIFNFEVFGQGETATVECDTAPFEGGKFRSTGTGQEHCVLVRLS